MVRLRAAPLSARSIAEAIFKGYDPVIYSGSLDSLFAAVLDVFAGLRNAPLRDRADFKAVYAQVRAFARRKLDDDVFRRSAFAALVGAAAAAATQRFHSLGRR